MILLFYHNSMFTFNLNMIISVNNAFLGRQGTGNTKEEQLKHLCLVFHLKFLVDILLQFHIPGGFVV